MTDKRLFHEVVLGGIKKRLPQVFSSSSTKEEAILLIELFSEAKLSETDRKKVASQLREFAGEISDKTTQPEIKELLLKVASEVASEVQ